MGQMEDLYPSKHEFGDKSIPSLDFVSDMIASNKPFDVDSFLSVHTKKYIIPEFRDSIQKKDQSEAGEKLAEPNSLTPSLPPPGKDVTGEVSAGRLRWTEIRR